MFTQFQKRNNNCPRKYTKSIWFVCGIENLVSALKKPLQMESTLVNRFRHHCCHCPPCIVNFNVTVGVVIVHISFPFPIQCEFPQRHTREQSRKQLTTTKICCATQPVRKCVCTRMSWRKKSTISSELSQEFKCVLKVS